MQKNANNFIGLNIKYLNDREKITQDEFGAVLGLKRGAISSYINKGIKPKYQTIQILSEIFQIPIDDLLNKDISILKVEDPGTSGLPGKSMPECYTGCAVCREKDARIVELRGEVEFLRQLINSQCIDRPGSVPHSETG